MNLKEFFSSSSPGLEMERIVAMSVAAYTDEIRELRAMNRILTEALIESHTTDKTTLMRLLRLDTNSSPRERSIQTSQTKQGTNTRSWDSIKSTLEAKYRVKTPEDKVAEEWIAKMENQKAEEARLSTNRENKSDLELTEELK